MIVILTKKKCIYCDKAKELMNKRNKKFVEFDIDDKPDLKEFMKANELFTVPQIFENGFMVGGYDDLVDMFDTVDAVKGLL